MERTEVSRNQIVSQLLHVGHGNLDIYNEIGLKAVQVEPELFGHVIVWNHEKGEVRDSKVAFPIIALRGSPDEELYENAVAHLCRLDPKNFLKAILFSRGLTAGKISAIQKVPVTSTTRGRKIQYIQRKVEIPVTPTPLGFGAGKILEKGITLYIRARESSRKWWSDTAIQHKKSLKSLYALGHIKPAPFAQDILFGRPTGRMIVSKFDGKLKPEIGPRIYPKGSVFEKIRDLKDMSPEEAAGTILNYKIPFIISVGALGGLKDKPDIILALMEQMSGAELVNNTQMLQRYGVFESPPLKAAYDKAIERTRKDKVSSLKATRAAEVVTDKKASRKLKQIQDQRLQELGGVEGDWLVLGDRSGSMSTSIVVAINVASLIAQQVKGKVYLTLFNTDPVSFDVTGKTLDQITDMTKRLRAVGGTSVGCGLDLLLEKGILVNGIAICSDGGDNTAPFFHEAYGRYAKKFGMEPPVYLFHVPGDADRLSIFCERERILIEKFQLGPNVDFYSLPNIVKTLRTSRYTLVEEIMEMTLLGFTDVFKELLT